MIYQFRLQIFQKSDFDRTKVLKALLKDTCLALNGGLSKILWLRAMKYFEFILMKSTVYYDLKTIYHDSKYI